MLAKWVVLVINSGERNQIAFLARYRFRSRYAQIWEPESIVEAIDYASVVLNGHLQFFYNSPS